MSGPKKRLSRWRLVIVYSVLGLIIFLLHQFLEEETAGAWTLFILTPLVFTCFIPIYVCCDVDIVDEGKMKESVDENKKKES